MRVLLQRVTRAEVRAADAIVGSIDGGVVALLAIGPTDDETTCRQMADKIVGLRIFRDEAGLANRSLLDVGGSVLAVSQFTLFAYTSRGRRPSFIRAARPALAERLYGSFCEGLESRGVRVGRGLFGAEMQVELVNDGPMTIWLDSEAA